MKEKKPQKKKSVFRTGAIVPFLIVTGVIVLFNILFLDAILKRSFEYVATNLNGAQVDVGDLSTSFSKLELKIENMQFTDKSAPERNLFEIGEIRFQVLWDALLKAKFVVDEIKVGAVEVLTERDSPGRVLPPAEGAGLRGKILEKTQEEFEGNLLGDVASLLQGKKLGDVKEEIEGDLDSKKEIEEASAKVENQEAKLKELYQGLPSEEELDALKQRFEKIDWSGLSNISKAPKVLKEIDELKEDTEKALNKYTAVSREIDQSVKQIEQAKKDIDQAVQGDINNLQERLNIPSLDPASIAKKLFGEELFGKFAQLELYKDKAKKYMPPKKEKKEEPSFVSPPRGEGRNYQFTQKNSYPLFWIKKISIDSKTEQGDARGEILDISSEQALTGRPMTADFQGDFPGIGVRNFSFQASLDHRQEKIKDTFSASVGQYQVTDKNLAQSDSVRFAIKKALVQSRLNAAYDGDKINLSLGNIFSKVDFDNAAESPEMLAVLNGIAQATSKITLDATAQGTPDSLKWRAKSNLAQALQKSVQARLQSRITDAQNKIRADIENEIGPRKKELEQKIAAIKSEANKVVEEGQSRLKAFNRKIDEEKKKAHKGAQKNILKGLTL